MTFVITQPCIDEMDQSCVDVCPVDCIHFEEGTDQMLYIDPVECIDCGACVDPCPVDAIFDEADLPADQVRFTEINSLWYQDAPAARAQAGGGAAAPAAAPAAATAEPAEAPATDDATDDAPAAVPATEAAPAEESAAAEAAPAAAAAAPAPTNGAAPLAVGGQVEALDEAPLRAGVIVSEYSLPSAGSLVALAGFAAAFFVAWVFPGPRWLEIADVDLSAGVLLATPAAIVFLLMFLRGQASDFAGFAAHHQRPLEGWRQTRADWRRSEESRQYELVRAVQQIAAERFSFPSADFPHYRTHVNLPTPTMAVEFGGGGSGKTYPDILVVEHPGNYPVMIAQVETRETLTRDQAERVWSQMEMAEAPLDVYVPAGLAARARDYARAAGLRHVRFRTWRHNPNGITVREV